MKMLKNRIIKLGEDPNFVFNFGCPRIDLVKEELRKNSVEFLEKNFNKNKGVGTQINFKEKILTSVSTPCYY